jgi:cytochrome c-type biogenesis protein CcmF
LSFCSDIALCISVVQALVPLIGTYRQDGAWMAVARPAAQGQFVFVAIAFGCHGRSFVGGDFSVLNASNSN